MSVEVFILAAASALRPSTSTAAVYALLSSERPRPVLAAFTVAGMLFSCAIGIVVVLALHGIPLPGGESERIAVVDIAGGAAMLGFAAGVGSGHVERLRRRRAPERPGRVVTMLRRPTLKVAGAAGVATHVPGLFYLVALNAIAAGSPSILEALAAVLVYNAIWFLVPIGAFVVAGRHAERAHAVIDDVNAWTRAHEQVIVVAVFASVGSYLVVKGAASLVS
jgi:Sap, sulfolipid-1-addressing protein